MHEFIQLLLQRQAEMKRKFANNITNGADDDKPSKKLQEKYFNILKLSDKLRFLHLLITNIVLIKTPSFYVIFTAEKVGYSYLETNNTFINKLNKY